MNKRTIRDLSDESVRGRRVLVRVDYNVPLAEGRVGGVKAREVEAALKEYKTTQDGAKNG